MRECIKDGNSSYYWCMVDKKYKIKNDYLIIFLANNIEIDIVFFV
jgi:hypothetical protein